MNEDAKKWSEAVDQAVQEVIKERKSKESGVPMIESKLESNLGKIGYKPEKTTTDKDIIQWMKQGRCSFCGGDFKGFFSKRCLKCGKPKDY